MNFIRKIEFKYNMPQTACFQASDTRVKTSPQCRFLVLLPLIALIATNISVILVWVIGGTACDILEENAGQKPRATKDIDIILIVEALTRDFVKRFWEFIKAGQYETRQRGNGKYEYFRFFKPQVVMQCFSG